MGRNKEKKRRDGVRGRRKGGIGENSEKRRERRLGAWWMLSLKMGDLERRTERRGETGKKEKNNEL